MFNNWIFLLTCLIQENDANQKKEIKSEYYPMCEIQERSLNTSLASFQIFDLKKKSSSFSYSVNVEDNPLEVNWPAVWDEEFIKNTFNVSNAMIAGRFGEIYNITEFLGGGGYGRIYKAVKKSTSEEVVVKFLRKSMQSNESGMKEGLILLGLDHPNIVKCLQLYSNFEYVQMVMKSSGSRTMGFHIYLNNIPFFLENVARFFLRQISFAVKYLHDINRAHLDIKDPNVVINDQLELQLIDFGFSEDLNILKEPIKGTVGTDHFIAPEIHFREFYGKRVDIWALGVTFYLVYHGRFPFDFDDKIRETIIPPNGLFKPIRESSEDFLHLLRWMLNVDDKKRATIDDVINHRWFKGSYEFERYLFETPFSADINELNDYFRVSYRSQSSSSMKSNTNITNNNNINKNSRSEGSLIKIVKSSHTSHQKRSTRCARLNRLD